MEQNRVNKHIANPFIFLVLPLSNFLLFFSRHDDINWKIQKSDTRKSTEEPELQEFFL